MSDNCGRRGGRRGDHGCSGAVCLDRCSRVLDGLATRHLGTNFRRKVDGRSGARISVSGLQLATADGIDLRSGLGHNTVELVVIIQVADISYTFVPECGAKRQRSIVSRVLNQPISPGDGSVREQALHRGYQESRRENEG